MKRVNVNIPPEVLETSRALQAANRDRLVRRERDERTRREAERQARKAREEQARSSAGGKKDPKNRGVPDVEDPPFFPLQRRGQKFKVAGAYCQFEAQWPYSLKIFTPDRKVSAAVEWYSELIKIEGYNFNSPFFTAKYSRFPAFVIAMPAGAGRTVITLGFDTWNYDRRGLGGWGLTLSAYWRSPFYRFYRNGPNLYDTGYELLEGPLQAWIHADWMLFKSYVVTASRVEMVPTPPELESRLREIYPRQMPIIDIEKARENLRGNNRFNYDIYSNYSVISHAPDPSFYDRRLLSSYGYGNLINKEPTTKAESVKSLILDKLSGLKVIRAEGRPENIDEPYLRENEIMFHRTGSNTPPPSLSPEEISIRNQIIAANSAVVPPDDRGFATPAVFAFLDRYTGEFNGTGEERPETLDYRYISNKYFPNDRMQYLLTVGYQPQEATEDETQNTFYFRPLEDYSSFQVPPILPKRNRVAGENVAMSAPPITGGETQAFNPLWDWKIVREMKMGGYMDSEVLAAASRDPTAINTWDWGRPLACILELLSLGFSSEALMLTAEELEAVADATPADRFNFSSPP